MTTKNIDAVRAAAVERFLTGYNCAESVFMAGGEIIGKQARSSAMTGFGGGIARTGSLCGAFTGGVAAIGLAVGRTEGSDKEAKDQVYRLVKEFSDRFIGKFGNDCCTELCGYDLTTREGVEAFVKADAHRQVCTKFVAGAVDILAEVLENVRETT